MRLLDLFCGAGGAATGYYRAGFTEIVGVDIKPQPRYPFTFIQADALKPPVDLRAFDLVHASPPCQAFCDLNQMYNAKAHQDLLTPTRRMLAGLRSVIENVPGSPLMPGSTLLCGTMFGLGTDSGAALWRHRYFESSVPIGLSPSCNHAARRVIGVYGGHGRDRRRSVNTQDFSTADRRSAMGIDWMTGSELSQAIPPAYTEWIGRRILEVGAE